MSDLTLSRGQNTALSGPRPLRVEVKAGAPLDVLAFVLGDDQKVGCDADFVFFNQPAHPSGAVILDGSGAVVVDPARLPAGASRVHIGVVAENLTLGDARVEVVLSQDDRTVVAPGEGLSVETSAVLIEIYRRGGEWKIRNTGAGWEGGFADLVRSHGVQVDDEPTGIDLESHVAERRRGVDTPPSADLAQLEAALLVELFVADRQEDHRDAGGDRVVHEPAADFVAVHVGHRDVEQDQVGHRRAGGQLQGALTPGGDARAEIRLVQAVDDGLDGVGRVVNDEDERAVAVYGVHYGLSRAAVGAVDVSA